jgi:hypothetical protein
MGEARRKLRRVDRADIDAERKCLKTTLGDSGGSLSAATQIAERKSRKQCTVAELT